MPGTSYTLSPEEEKQIVIVKMPGQEIELPFTKKELKDFESNFTKNTGDEKLSKALAEKVYWKADSLTDEDLDKIIAEIPEKNLKYALLHYGRAFSDTKREIKLDDKPGVAKISKRYIPKLLERLKTYELGRQVADEEEKEFQKKKQDIDNAISKILSSDEPSAKQLIKDMSKEDRNAFNKAYKERIGEMHKAKPNAEELIQKSIEKVKSRFDKAMVEKAKQDKLAKAEEAQKSSLLPPQATAVQPSQPRSLSKGRSILRSKSATRNETEEPKRVQVAETSRNEEPKREEPLSSDLRSAYKELRREITDIGRDNREYSSAQILRRLGSKIPDEVLIEDALNLPTLEQITEAIDQRDKNKLKEYMREYEAEPINYGNRKIVATLKSLLGDEGYSNPIDRLSARTRYLFGTGTPTIDKDRQFNNAKEQLKKDLPEVQKALLTTIESRPKLKEAYERLMKKREEETEVQATTEKTTPSLVSALSRTVQEEAEPDEEEAFQEDLRRAKRESIREQEEEARNRSGKRGVVPQNAFETALDQEIDEEAFKEAEAQFPRTSVPVQAKRKAALFPSEMPTVDDNDNPIDSREAMKDISIKVAMDKANYDFQNPPKLPTFFGLEPASIIANKMREDFAREGNPLSEQYRKQMNELAERMVKDKLIEHAGKILETSPSETDREDARKFLKDQKLIDEAAKKFSKSPTFREDFESYLTDKEYESQAADLLKPDTTYEGKAAETLDNLPDLTPDINFELSDEEKALHEANVKAFIDQATRNFERTELRRAKNRNSGRNVWNSGLAAKERSEIWQDFNRHLADKQLQMLNEAKQQSFLKKKELHEQRARQASALLQKSKAWLETNVLKNRNQTEMANALSGLQGLNLQRAKDYSAYEAVLNAGRQGDVQALATLRMTQQEAAQQFERIQHQKDLSTLQRATGLANIGGQHGGQLINQANMFASRASDEDQKLMNMIGMGDMAGERVRQEKERENAHQIANEAASRDAIDKGIHRVFTYANTAQGITPSEAPVQSNNLHPVNPFIPNPQPPVDRSFTDTVGALTGIGGMAMNFMNADKANALTQAQTNVANAKTALLQNQIEQMKIPGVK